MPPTRPVRSLIAAVALACLAVGSPAPAGAAPGTLALSTTTVDAAPDFAGESYADAWDFSNPQDLSTDPVFAGGNVGPGRYRDGTYEVDVRRGGWLDLVRSVGGALPHGRDAALVPIDAGRYTRMSVRMWSSTADTAQVWWFSCTEADPRCYGATQFRTQPGWQTYDFPLVESTGQPVQWSGRLLGLRLDPAALRGGAIALDDVRLYEPRSQNRVTVRRAGGSGTAELVVSRTRAQDGTVTAVRTDVQGTTVQVPVNGSASWDTSMLPQGTWYVGLRDASGTVQYAPEPLTVRGIPMPVILNPDLGGGADFSEALGSPRLDFSELSDVAAAYNVQNLRVAGGVLFGQNGGPTPADNQIVLRTPPAIDGSRFHRLTLRLGYDGTFGLENAPGGGMVARLIWTVNGSPLYQDLNDLVVVPGDQTITVDLSTNPPGLVTDEGTPARIGWRGQQITSVRFDPNEDPSAARSWRVDDIRIAEDDRGAGTFDIQFEDRNWAPGTVADIYVDRGTPGQNRAPVEMGVPVSAGVNTYRWALRSLPEGTYWPYVVLRRGSTSGDIPSSGPVQMTQQPAFGAVDRAQQTPAGLRVQGWSIDPLNAGATSTVHVYVDGRGLAAVTADTERPDVGAAFGYGDRHGFEATIPGVGPGQHSVCAYAFRGGRQSPSLGCRTVTVGSAAIGAWDATVATTGGVRVSGWTVDPNTANPTDVHVYVDGRGAAVARADRPRDDVAAAFPGYGAAHGFEIDTPVPLGRHEVCLYAIDAAAPGPNSALGCRTVTVEGAPLLAVDTAVRSGSTVSFSGWVLDPASTQAAAVHVYVDGRGAAIAPATADRPDVAAAFRTFAPRLTGYTGTVAVGAGAHTVCWYGVGTRGASAPLCRQL